ncbi:MAG: putative 2-hydroxyacid dehydrogenase [Segetibacter sp.]|jgi:C-terminal binding protein|nr:putative 2-hydroxyacid dehydrogenase [Segetibacter sp.]
MDKKYRIVITDFIADSLAVESEIIGNGAEIIALDAYNEKDLEGQIEDVDAIIMYHSLSMTRKTIDNLKQCRLIVRAGVGFDNVDHIYARTRGIPVANIPDYGSEDVADSAIGMMLSLTRGISFLNSRLRDGLGEWSYTQVRPLTRLRNRKVGIVGLGRIGTAAALRAKSLGMDVMYYDPFKPDGFDKALGIRRAESLQSLLEQVQILTLHCPLTPTTHYLINENTLTYLPEGSYLINTSRGGVVDTSAIPAAIETGRLAGAAFDVLETEPPVDDALIQAWKNPDHPAYHKVIINPHSAFYSEEGLKEIRVKSAEACLRALRGEEIRNIVN